MKSYLMLDVDGVLNHRRSSTRDGLFTVDPRNVDQLNRLVEDTQPEIVVTSTWRFNHDTETLRELLAAAGFEAPGLVIGQTGCVYSHMVPSIQLPESHFRRGSEIVHWLETFAKPPCGLAILDDDSDMWVLRDRLVRTTFDHGLTAEHVEPAILLLQTPLTELPDSTVARLIQDPFTGTGGPRATHIHRGD